MIDSYTNVIYGWKFIGEEVDKLKHELEVWDEDYMDNTQNICVFDYMCGDYLYIGARLGRFDNSEDNEEIIVNDKLINSSTKKFNDFIKDNPEFDNIIKDYIKDKKPQLYIMQQFC
ncbi:hypothetical protein IKN40_04860 [bacterium]|nr:hypothetical protein [bacterium]